MTARDVAVWRPARALAAFVALAAALSVVALRVPAYHAQARLAPDSITYLEPTLMRTPLYPLVLQMVKRLPDGLNLLPAFQQLVLGASAVLLSWEFFLTFRRLSLALLLETAVLGHPQLVSYCFTVLPEALFASVLMIHLSCALVLARGVSRSGFAGAGVSAATLALVKPSGYAAVAGLAVLAFVHRDQWRKVLWLVVPATLVILAACVANFFVRGFFGTQAQAGTARSTYTARLLERTTPTPYPILVEHLALHARPIGIALQSLPGIDDYYLIAAEEFHGIEQLVQREVIEEVSRGHDAPATGAGLFLFPTDPAVAARVNAIGNTVADAAIRQHASEYVYGVAANIYGLWWLPLVKTVDGAAARQSELDKLVAERPALSRASPAFRPLPRIVFVAVRLILILIFVSSIIGVFWLVSLSAVRRTVAYLALLLHGYFLLVSLAQPGLPRYAIAVWPASALLLVATAAALRYRESQPRAQ